ncbi:MAG: GC-type dockerin domain-anchored protein [Phycisphaerales bacterium JB052]
MFQHKLLYALTLIVVAISTTKSHAQSMTCAAWRFVGSIEQDGFFAAYSYIDPFASHEVVAGTAHEIKTFDHSGADLIEIDSHVFADQADAIMRAGDYIFRSERVFGDDSILYVYEPTDPSHPTKIATAAVPGQYDRVVMTKDHLFCFRRSYYTIDILDFSNPSAPALVNSVTYTSSIRNLRVLDENTLLLANGSREVHTLDLTDPAHPTPISVFDAFTSTSAWGISAFDVGGDLVYVNDGCDDLLVLDYSDPGSPMKVGEYPIQSCPSGIVLDGDQAYLTYTFSGFDTLDLSNPTQPAYLTHIQTRPYFQTLVPTHSKVFISTSKRPIAAIDKYRNLNGTSPNQATTDDPSDYRAVELVADHAYAAASDGLLTTTDITDPFNPVLIDTQATTGPADDLVIHNGFAYVAVLTGFDVFDLADPDQPMWVRYVDDARAIKLAVDGNLLVATASEPSGFAIFDLTDPANPQQYNSSINQIAEYPREIILKDETLYCACGYSTFVAVDLSNPQTPIITDQYFAPQFAEFAEALTIQGSLAYVGTDYGYLYTFDITDPSNLQLLSDHFLAPEIRSLQLSEDRLAMGYNGLHLYDLADPISPQYISSAQSPGTASPRIRDGIYYAAAGDAGLWSVDITDCGTCAADLTGDLVHDFFDISVFISNFNRQDPIADFEPDGEFNFFDVSAFLDAFQTGCP